MMLALCQRLTQLLPELGVISTLVVEPHGIAKNAGCSDGAD